MFERGENVTIARTYLSEFEQLLMARGCGLHVLAMIDSKFVQFAPIACAYEHSKLLNQQKLDDAVTAIKSICCMLLELKFCVHPSDLAHSHNVSNLTIFSCIIVKYHTSLY